MRAGAGGKDKCHGAARRRLSEISSNVARRYAASAVGEWVVAGGVVRSGGTGERDAVRYCASFDVEAEGTAKYARSVESIGGCNVRD